MSEDPAKKPAGFAPFDYSDGRERGEWKTRYPQEARVCIRWETLYLIVISILYLGAVFYVISLCAGDAAATADHNGASATAVSTGSILLIAFGAWSAGALGGCSFGIKWMYHSVAKQLWNEDRRLWRLLSPHVSGVVSLIMVLLIASNLVQVFDENLVHSPISVIAFSFLVGYFSDKALAKMADVADTIFGGNKRGGG